MFRKIILLYVIWHWSTNVLGQQTSVEGVVSIQNSETYTGKRKYVTNALVEDDGGKANPTLTQSSGQFKLIFSGIEEHQLIRLTVRKEGLVVVNETDLKAITGQKEVIKIYMTHPDSVNENRMKFYQIGVTAGAKKLSSALATVIKKKALLQIDTANNNREIRRLNDTVEDLQLKLSLLDAQSKQLAAKYASINLDDVSTIYKTAFLLFQNGQTDSALIVLNQIDFSQDVTNILENDRRNAEMIREGERLINEGRKGDSQNKIYARDRREALELKIDLHRSNFEYDSVSVYYEFLISLDTGNYKYSYDYAKFLDQSNQLDASLKCYKRTLELCNRLPKHSRIDPNIIPDSENRLGQIYHKKNDLEKSKYHFSRSLQIFKILEKFDSVFYRACFAGVMINVGSLYSTYTHFDTAKVFFLKSLGIYENLSRQGPQNYQSEIAGIYMSLGSVYLHLNDMVMSDSFNIKALNAFRNLYSLDPEMYRHDYVNILNNVAQRFIISDSSKSMQFFSEALGICKDAVKKESQAYLPDLALVEINFAEFYRIYGNLEKSEFYLLDALSITRNLSTKNTDVYETDVAGIYLVLGSVYRLDKKYKLAEQYFFIALSGFEKLTLHNPKIYSNYVARSKAKIGLLYTDTKQFGAADICFSESVDLFKTLMIKDKRIVEGEFLEALYNYGKMYQIQNELERSSSLFLQALTLYEDSSSMLALNDKETEGLILENLGDNFQSVLDFTEAKKHYLKAKEIFIDLEKTNAKKYKADIEAIEERLNIINRNRRD